MKLACPATSRDTITGQVYARDAPPDADYAVIVKDEIGGHTTIVLAGIGARSTLAACRYFTQGLDAELARLPRYSCIIRSSLRDPHARAVKIVDDQAQTDS